MTALDSTRTASRASIAVSRRRTRPAPVFKGYCARRTAIEGGVDARARARGRAGAGQGAMPRVHAAAPRERMSSSNQIIYLVPLHLVPDSREALAEVGEVRVVLGPRGLDPLDLVADGDDSRGRAGRRPRSHRARGRRPPRSTRRTTTRCPRPRRATSRWSRRPFGGSASSTEHARV